MRENQKQKRGSEKKERGKRKGKAKHRRML